MARALSTAPEAIPDEETEAAIAPRDKFPGWLGVAFWYLLALVGSWWISAH